MSTIEPRGPLASTHGVARVSGVSYVISESPETESVIALYAASVSYESFAAMTRRVFSLNTTGIAVSGARLSCSIAEYGSTGMRTRFDARVPVDRTAAGCQLESSNSAAVQPVASSRASKISSGGTGSIGGIGTSCRYGARYPFQLASEAIA